MTQYSTLNVNFGNWQVKKLKYEIKMVRNFQSSNLSSNLIGNSNDDINFPHKLLLIDTQFSKVRKAFATDSSANMKISKTQLPKIVPLGWIIFNPPNILSSPVTPIITSLTNTIINWFVKQLKNNCTKSNWKRYSCRSRTYVIFKKI